MEDIDRRTTSKLLKDGMLSREVIAERVPMRSQRKGWKVQHLMSQHGHIKDDIIKEVASIRRTVAQELIKCDAVESDYDIDEDDEVGLDDAEFSELMEDDWHLRTPKVQKAPSAQNAASHCRDSKG